MGLVKRSGSGSCGGNLGSLDLGGELPGPVADLVAFITQEQWPDGSERTPGTILLCSGDGLFKVWLCDKDADCSAWVTGSSLYDVLERANAICGGEAHEWRRNKPRGRKG